MGRAGQQRVVVVVVVGSRRVALPAPARSADERTSPMMASAGARRTQGMRCVTVVTREDILNGREKLSRRSVGRLET